MPLPARSQENNKPQHGKQLIRFDRYQVDVSSGELLKEGRKIRLQPQPFQLLVLLARNAGQVVSREEIQRELWRGDTFVDFDHGLASAINKVREALCDSAENPRLIETLHKRGYRFVGKVEPEPPVEIRARLEGVSHESATTRTAETKSSVWRGAPTIWGALAVVLLIVAAVMGSMWVHKNARPTITPAQEWNVSQFTAYAGNSTGPAFSPDGSRIVFAWSGGKDEKKHELYVKALGGETLLQLTHHPSEWLSAAWSPDGTQVAFMRVDGADTGLYLVPALGGVERKLLATTTPYGLTAPISWSPDEKWIAYNDLAPGTTENRNFLYSMETHKSHLFYHDAVCRHEANLTFSNDGKQLAWYCVRALDQIDLMLGDVEGHSRRVVTTPRMPPIGLSWGFDDSTMVLTLQNAAHSEIFEVDVRNGSVTKASGAAGDLLASWAAVSPKTRSLTWSSSRYHVDLIREDLKDGGKLGTAGERGESYLYSSRNQNQASYSPDGKHVAFDSDRSGIWNVWIGDVDGSNLIQISHGGIAGYPRWSPDSRRIAYQQYDVDTSNQSSIYIADITERTPHKLMTATQSVAAPFWSADGRLIYFQDEGAFIRKYYQCSLQCDKNEVLVRDGQKATNMQISDDGKYWYYMEGEGDERVFRGVMKEGRVQDEKEIAGLPILNDEHAFFVAKNGIYFASAEKPNTLQYFDLATGKTKSVFTAEKPISDGIWVSSDDRYALVSQSSDTHQDIMLAEPKH